MLQTYLKRIGWFSQARSLVRCRLEEGHAARMSRHYQREATARGLVVPTGTALEDALRRRLAGRRRGRGPKAMGELHVFLAYTPNNWEFVLPMSLAPFGKVTVFEMPGTPDWFERRDETNRRMLDAFQSANAEAPVDAVVGYLAGINTAPEILTTMGEAGAVIFNFCFDDKLHFPGPIIDGRHTSPAALAHAVDLNLTNAQESTVKYAVHGGLALFWPQGAQPEIHKPHDIGFDFDVSFVGARYGWRPWFITRLRRLGVKVECFGKGWPNGPLNDQDMIRLYSRSRINLGLAGVGHCRTLKCLKGRDFELPMSGGLYLTQHHPELELVYDVGREIVTYRNEVDCAQLICELLEDPARARAIREAGREKALRQHTWQSRWRQVFAVAGLVESGDRDR